MNAERPTDEQVYRDTAHLAAEIHEAWEFQYDECDHGTYSGGGHQGKPYAMCELMASRIVRRRAAGVAPPAPSEHCPECGDSMCRCDVDWTPAARPAPSAAREEPIEAERHTEGEPQQCDCDCDCPCCDERTYCDLCGKEWPCLDYRLSDLSAPPAPSADREATLEEYREGYEAWKLFGADAHRALLEIWHLASQTDTAHMTYGDDPGVVVQVVRDALATQTAPSDDREKLIADVLALAKKTRDRADRWANVLGEIALGDEAYAQAELLRQAADALAASAPVSDNDRAMQIAQAIARAHTFTMATALSIAEVAMRLASPVPVDESDIATLIEQVERENVSGSAPKRRRLIARAIRKHLEQHPPLVGHNPGCVRDPEHPGYWICVGPNAQAHSVTPGDLQLRIEKAVGAAVFNAMNHPVPEAVLGRDITKLRNAIVQSVMEAL